MLLQRKSKYDDSVCLKCNATKLVKMRDYFKVEIFSDDNTNNNNILLLLLLIIILTKIITTKESTHKHANIANEFKSTQSQLTLFVVMFFSLFKYLFPLVVVSRAETSCVC